ncbi:alpha-amylase family glycosyl hydrolase [Oligoflexus tunisiensis]|uniref:alpha-amylase family glycosyl hydrolase n=1 Tax=Oligoflexus tunisiensis TaxID=708132 RepID=UPI00114D1FDD|nr:alpha-amylase family glycosyl hydrolase [Oligoflexus tunisiensis]
MNLVFRWVTSVGLASLGLSGMAFGTTCQQTFSYKNANASSVWITGSFTDWARHPDLGAIPLTKSGDVWTATVTLPAGKNLYKFVVDGRSWVADPNALLQEADGFGAMNSIHPCGDDPVVTQPLPQCGHPEAFDWRDTVMYFALVDRFHDSDGRASPVPGATGGDAQHGPSAQYVGGDFQGMTRKMDYLTDLGVTALWLSAPYDARDESGASVTPDQDPHLYSGYHGYWPSPRNIDYSKPEAPSPRPRVESRLGTEEELKELIATAHGAASANGHGVKVLFDYVMKHVDSKSELYQAHRDWFATDNGRIRVCGPENLWEHPYWGTRCSFTDYLPGFDFYNPEVRRWSVSDAVWWAREFQLDGLRLDAVKHIPGEWLIELRQALKETFPNPEGDRFYLVGEVFDYYNKENLKKYVDSQTMLDGQFDFPFKKTACEALFRPDGDIGYLDYWLSSNDRYYDRGLYNRSLMVNWIGNHDIPRAIHFASRQIDSCVLGSFPGNGWSSHQYQQPLDAAPYERLGLAFATMLTNPGIPLIYYGDEIGLAGGGDPDNRRMMPWDDRQLNIHQLVLRDKVRKLAHIRARYKVLGRGQRRTHWVDRDAWVYTMGGCDGFDQITVAINKSDGWKNVALPAGTYEDLMQGGRVTDSTLSLAPRSFRVLKAD